MTDKLELGAPEPFTLPGATRRTVTTTAPVAGDWEISVALPTGPFAGDGPFPTLYVVDPSATFATTAHVATTTTMLSMGLLPPVAVVGIGPATTDFYRVMVQRNRDLTPTTYDHPAIAAMNEMGTGGGGAFLELLVDHIIPALEAELPLDPTDRGIGGWSLGGLFTCSAMLGRPDAFRRYLAVSPSLWWDDRSLLDAAAVGSADLAGRRVYLAVGELETEHTFARAWPPMPEASIEATKGVDMVRDMRELAAMLRARGDVVVFDEMLTEESHSLAWTGAIARGLVRLYASGFDA